MRRSFSAVLLALLLPACAAAVPPYTVQVAALPPRSGQAPPPAGPDYAQTIRYIDAGLKYISPINAFFVSPRGGMCFRGVNVAGQRYPIDRWNFWCVDPHMVSSVDALTNDISYVPQVRIWCKHANGYCAQRVGEPEFPVFGPVGMANGITIQIVPPQEERAAIEHLVRLLGGRLDNAERLN